MPRKSEKMPKYMPNLHYIMPNLLHLHINKLTLSIMCVKDIVAKKNFNKRKPVKWLIMCAKTINYFFYH